MNIYYFSHLSSFPSILILLIFQDIIILVIFLIFQEYPSMSQMTSNYSGDQFTSQNQDEGSEFRNQFDQEDPIPAIQMNQSDQKMQHEQQGRKFGCPCGKNYLSAPALYTHVKIKHNGVPPGKLIRPGGGRRGAPPGRRSRGRPRVTQNTVFVDTVQQDSDMIFDAVEEINKRLQNISVQYEEVLETSSGSESCQDMASSFLIEIKGISMREIKIVTCFLNYLKQFIQNRLGSSYWKQGQPGKIIEIANSFVKNHNLQSRKKFPLQQSTLIDLLYILCKWMYKQKWTNNKLIRRTPSRVYLKNDQ